MPFLIFSSFQSNNQGDGTEKERNAKIMNHTLLMDCCQNDCIVAISYRVNDYFIMQWYYLEIVRYTDKNQIQFAEIAFAA